MGTLCLTQLLILVPSFIFILIHNVDLIEWMQFRRIKISTVLLVIVFTFLIMPFISLINVISQLFTTNAAIELSSRFDGLAAPMIVFMIGILGPFCEEFTFRGVIFGGLRRSGYIFAAAVVSALFFGLMHLNLNQLSYALVLGVVFGMLVEGTGSIWASVTAHVVINTWNAALMLIADKMYSAMGIDILSGVNEQVTLDDKLQAIGILLVMSLFFTALAAGVYIFICKNQGRFEHVVSMFCKPEKKDDEEVAKPHVLSAAGYIAIFLCLFVIFLLDMVLDFFM
jgi:membrane protease YdiL (CAAX protease family)